MSPPNDEWVDTEFQSGDWCILYVWTGACYEKIVEGPWTGELDEMCSRLTKAFKVCGG